MRLTQEERFAMQKLFGSGRKFDAAIIAQLDSAEAIERRETGVGFFSTIRFPASLPDSDGRLQWDWNFTHKGLGYGGSFIAYYEPPDVIVLEGVAHNGEWPKQFDATAFSEA